MLKVGDRCIFVTPPEHRHQDGYFRWEGVRGVVASQGGSYICMKLDRCTPFWPLRDDPVFESRLLQPLRVPLSPFEADLLAYIDAEKKELGLS